MTLEAPATRKRAPEKWELAMMKNHAFRRNDEGSWVVHTNLTGNELLHHPLLTKGTAFTHEERAAFELEGLLPDVVSTMDQQAKRAYENVVRYNTPLERYMELASLQDRNETLFFKVLTEHIEELMPIVYTPTVGEAIVEFSRNYRRPRGVWITPQHRGRIADVLQNAACAEIRLIVVTDNERILGLGDQGAGGIGISIGKLALYCAGAGIHPAQVLPVSLDVGTDNETLLEDPLYVGLSQSRLRGVEYDELVDEFVQAVRVVYPNALLQWEDFKKQRAFDNLDRHRETLPSFNDDIEGTAAVALAGVIAACRGLGTEFRDQRVLMVGGGAAGIGIARLLREALSEEGIHGDELFRRIAVMDSRRLLSPVNSGRDEYKDEFAWPQNVFTEFEFVGGESLETVVRRLKPTVLIGTTGIPDTFDEAAIRALADVTQHPIVMPYSNPTSHAEATPKDILEWTKGAAWIATGSPFEPVELDDGTRVRIGQGNNVFIFPGVGLGALVAEASIITPSMFAVAARTLATCVSEEDLAERAVFPRATRLREVSRAIGIAVATVAFKEGVARADLDSDSVESVVDAAMWSPHYPQIVVGCEV